MICKVLSKDVFVTLFGYSKRKYEVFVLPGKTATENSPKIEPDTKILRLNEVTTQQWRQVKKLQGWLPFLYLRWRYSSTETQILLAFSKGKLVHVEWIVPAHKLKARYCFLPDNSYSVISCFTLKEFRGLGLYSSQIQKVITSDIGTKQLYMWAARDNNASLKGIRKAGGIKVGEFVQKRRFWGCMSHIEYFPERSNNK